MLSIAVCDDILLECTQLAKQIRHIAKKAGWEVLLREFYTGEELLKSTASFDILFLDIKMPGLDGMELASESTGPRNRKTAQDFLRISLSLLFACCEKNSLT